MTLTDPKTEYAPCPWCGQPGRLIVTDWDGEAVWYMVGCKNEDCLVQPRTNKIVVLRNRIKKDAETAIRKSIERWERRE